MFKHKKLICTLLGAGLLVSTLADASQAQLGVRIGHVYQIDVATDPASPRPKSRRDTSGAQASSVIADHEIKAGQLAIVFVEDAHGVPLYILDIREVPVGTLDLFMDLEAIEAAGLTLVLQTRTTRIDLTGRSSSGGIGKAKTDVGGKVLPSDAG